MSKEETTAEKAKSFSVKKDAERADAARLKCVLISNTAFDLTIPAAERVLTYKTFKAERDVNENHIQELYDEMVSGRFRSEHVNLATAELDGEIYRVNGQHTCWARTFMPANYSCIVRKLDYRVPDMEQLRKLYSVFDPSYASRTVGHLTRVLLVDTPETEGIWTSMIPRMAAAYRFWKYESEDARRRMGHNEIANEVKKNSAIFQKVAIFAQAYYNEVWFGRRMAVLAALFECIDKRPSLIDGFWKPVADGLGLMEKNDPRYALRNWLMSRSLNIGEGGRREKEKVTSPEEMYRVCISAWNTWRANGKVTVLRPTHERRVAK